MKSIFRFIITQLLSLKARAYLKKCHVQVIAVTGSVGKTSTKEAIYHILQDRFKIHRSPHGFNTPLGISLAILQEEESGFSSIFAWIKILKRIFSEKKKPYQKIILEMGADQPGDIKKLIRIAPPDIAVVTCVKPVHLGKGQFKDLADIQKEKNNLILHLPKENLAILNFDDPLVREMHTTARKIGYGISPDCQLQAQDVRTTPRHLIFTAHYKGKSAEVRAPVLGSFQIHTLLPAIAVGLSLGLELEDCAKALHNFQLPPSRMNPLPGVKGSTIIDSSYNASPASMAKALELLTEVKGERKIAALGTMNELGEGSREAHLNLGRQAAASAHVLIAVGQEAAVLKQGAIEAGMPEQDIYTFFDSQEAGCFLKEFILPNDLILVKGSQNRVRMERLVKIIMEFPEKARHLLCRQEEGWEGI